MSNKAAAESEFEQTTARVIQAINKLFADDAYLVKHRNFLPASNMEELFLACGDGVLFCKLALMISPGGLSEKKINHEIDTNFLKDRVKNRRNDPNTRSVFQITQNYNLFTGAMSKIQECASIIIGSDDILTVNNEVIVKSLVILLKSVIINRVRINNHPNLVRFIQKGETVDSLQALGPEKLLVRWLNFQMVKAGVNVEVRNLTSDLRDCTVLLSLLKQIAPPDEVDIDAISAAIEIPPNRPERPVVVIDTVNRLGCAANASVKEITSGDKLPMITLVAAIFDRCPALDFPAEDETLQLETTIRNLKVKLAEYEKSSFLTNRGKNAMEELDNLTDENQRLRERIEDLENENEFFKQKAERLEIEKEGLKQNKFSSVEEKFKSISESYQTMLNEKKVLVDELQGLLATKEKELQEEKRKRQNMEEETKRMQQDVDTMLKDLSQLPATLSKKEKSKESLRATEKERIKLSNLSLAEETKENGEENGDENGNENGKEKNGDDEDEAADDDDESQKEKKKKKKDKDSKRRDKKDKKKKREEKEDEDED